MNMQPHSEMWTETESDNIGNGKYEFWTRIATAGINIINGAKNSHTLQSDCVHVGGGSECVCVSSMRIKYIDPIEFMLLSFLCKFAWSWPTNTNWANCGAINPIGLVNMRIMSIAQHNRTPWTSLNTMVDLSRAIAWNIRFTYRPASNTFFEKCPYQQINNLDVSKSLHGPSLECWRCSIVFENTHAILIFTSPIGLGAVKCIVNICWWLSWIPDIEIPVQLVWRNKVLDAFESYLVEIAAFDFRLHTKSGKGQIFISVKMNTPCSLSNHINEPSVSSICELIWCWAVYFCTT